MSNILNHKQLIKDHYLMLKVINSLPIVPTPYLLSNDQYNWILNRKHHFQLIGKRIDYLQMLQLGFRPIDPLDRESLPDSYKKRVVVETDKLFSLLQIMIGGWDLIKSKAEEEGLDFPFKNPRQLFAKALEQIINEKLREIILGNECFVTMTDMRKNHIKENAFLRERLEASEIENFLTKLQQGNWYDYAIYATWNHRKNSNNKNLKNAWKEFIHAHKTHLKYINEKGAKEDGGEVTTLYWCNGVALTPKDKRKSEWDKML